MNFKYDLFISYHPADNEPKNQSQKGWVTNFIFFLDTLLSQLLGEKPSIITSTPGSLLTNMSSQSLSMISILSPSYVESVSCIKEAEAYYKEIEKDAALTKDGIPRIFKVLKSYVPTNKHPDGLKELVGYNLFHIDLITGESEEITDFFNNEAEKTYWLRLVDLAYDLYDLIITSKNKKTESYLTINSANENIYLANTARDLAVQRDVIRRELQRHGYNVFPKHTIASDAPNLEQLIVDDLEKCKLSIHLISGTTYNHETSKNNTLPIIQNKVAAKYSAEINEKYKDKDYLEFSRFIWIPPDVRSSDDQQKIFIENFKRNADLVAGADLLMTPLEELKTIIRNELHEINLRKNASTQSFKIDTGKPLIYFICDKMDNEKGKKIADHLSVSGYNVLLPEFSENILESRQVHQLNLNNCDAVMIYTDKVSEKWVNSKVHDILKAPGFGRKKTFKAKALFFEKDVEIKNKYIQEADFIQIKNNGDFLSELLRPFTSKLQ